MIKDIGKPIMNMSISIACTAFHKSAGNFPPMNNGTTARFITHQTNMPYSKPVNTLLLAIIFILGYIQQKKMVKTNAMMK